LSEIISIKHSYNAGDLIVALPGLRQLWRDTGKKVRIYQRLNLPAFYYSGQIDSTLDDNNMSVCMNNYLFSMLKPLIEVQEYIDSFVEWKGEKVDLDYDMTRDSRAVPAPNALLTVWSEAIFPETATDISEKWIYVNEESIKKEYYKNRVIINRTQRYQNPYISYYFLKLFQDQLLFSGTEAEHTAFCTQWDLQIEHLKVDDFYYLAQIMKWCSFGIYNQSFNFHLANSMHTPRILELCPQFPNTFCIGPNGRQFYHQSALEFHFSQLIKTK